MDTRQVLSSLGIITLSSSSALNNLFLRKEKINDVFPDHSLANYILNLLNYISFVPELEYNEKYNTRLYSLLKGEIVNPHNDKIKSSRLFLSSIAILSVALFTTLAHIFLYYDANSQLFKNQMQLNKEDPLPQDIFIFICFFSVLGATQHWLQGAIELAEGVTAEPPQELFCSSQPIEINRLSDFMRFIFNLITYDVLGSAALFLAAVAEFVLFLKEFDTQITHTRFPHAPGLNKSFDDSICLSLSFMSASMYLGHEGRALLKVKSMIKNVFENIDHGIYKKMKQKELQETILKLICCTAHAVVHSLARYQALNANNILLPPFVMACTGLSGVSRLALLYEGKVDQPISTQMKGSIKYDAHRRGEDILYEISIIGVIGFLSLLSPENDHLSPSGIFIIASAPAIINEVIAHCADHLRYDPHKKYITDFIINVLTTPFITTLLIMRENNYSKNIFIEYIGAQLVIYSLFVRHAQKKLVSYVDINKDRVFRARQLFFSKQTAEAKEEHQALLEPKLREDQPKTCFSRCKSILFNLRMVVRRTTGSENAKKIEQKRHFTV